MAKLLVTVCMMLLAARVEPLQTVQESLRLPGVQPKEKDTYLCMAKKLTSTPSYIVGFNPHSDMSKAHHMLLYGCSQPAFTKKVWSCGEMHHSSDRQYDNGPICLGKPKILYAWALDAKSLPLPKDVAFKVGGNTGIDYLVLQVHYKNVTSFNKPYNKTDNSGIVLTTTKTELPKRAGVYLLGTFGSLPPHSTVYMESACVFSEPIKIHPFAFRAHTHKHGEVVSGYRIRNGRWTEIGRIDPLLPEMFYNVTNPGIDVIAGDILAARCTMKNDENREVNIGATQNDEMCNFYIMYWVKDDGIIKDDNCFSSGPPMWSWRYSDIGQFMNLDREPKDASTKPETGETFEQQFDEREILYNTNLNPVQDEDWVGVERQRPSDQQRYGYNPWYPEQDDDESYPQHMID